MNYRAASVLSRTSITKSKALLSCKAVSLYILHDPRWILEMTSLSFGFIGFDISAFGDVPVGGARTKTSLAVWALDIVGRIGWRWRW